MLETQSNRAGSHNFPGMAHHLEICPDSCSRASTDYPLIHDFIAAMYLYSVGLEMFIIPQIWRTACCFSS